MTQVLLRDRTGYELKKRTGNSDRVDHGFYIAQGPLRGYGAMFPRCGTYCWIPWEVSSQSKKNPGRIPKKIHKAEREKLKRDHLNELFLELGNAFDSTRQNNEKATILIDATRLLRDLLSQISVERNELQDENAILEVEVEKLQTQLHGRTPSDTTWNASSAKSQQASATSSLQDDNMAMPVADSTLQTTPVVAPVYVVPFHYDFKPYSDSETADAPKMLSNVSRPHARCHAYHVVYNDFFTLINNPFSRQHTRSNTYPYMNGPYSSRDAIAYAAIVLFRVFDIALKEIERLSAASSVGSEQVLKQTPGSDESKDITTRPSLIICFWGIEGIHFAEYVALSNGDCGAWSFDVTVTKAL
ncbi:hypothetical protein Syun_006455 [Stephania yunnanensis]|uniref:BHLH domain-containing protein n=1 Tax=Stephania yunnanensis TaxID=152371 RepID=A0AAP0KYA2_9MAGN